MRYLISLLLMCLTLPALASVELDTSINDVYYRGDSELLGSITWTVTGSDFADVTTDEPYFIRITPDHGSVLSETLVQQSSTDPVLSQPINLALKLDGGNGLISMVANADAVSIVRWVEGESSFWIRVQQSSDVWLSDGGVFTGPSNDLNVSFTAGISARLSDIFNDSDATVNNSNLPFNTRELIVDEGDYEEATSTLFCVDLTNSNLLADGSIESLLNFDIINFDHFADLGGGVYSGQAGNDTGINFPGNFSIGRGKDRACNVFEFDDNLKSQAPVSLLCIEAPTSNRSPFGLVNVSREFDFFLSCDSGGNLLSTNLVSGSFFTFTIPEDRRYGFYDEILDVQFVGESGHAVLSNPTFDHGYTLYKQANLIYTGETQSLDNSVVLTVQVGTWMHYTEDPTLVDVDWGLTLFNHESAYDTEPYFDPGYDADGDFADQNRRCEPSSFVVDGGSLIVGFYEVCAGDPVSVFFPFVPAVTGDSDLWVGFSYVNQGAKDLDVEVIFYDENGYRYTGDLGKVNVHSQKTWLFTQDDTGVPFIQGVGANNTDEFVFPEPYEGSGLTPADLGTTRTSMFLRGTFETEYFEDVTLGDLDGYLLVGNRATNSIDGAYLPRNFDNSKIYQNADMPLLRNKRALTQKRTVVTKTIPNK